MVIRLRRVFGTLRKGDGTPLVGVVLPFSLQPGSFTVADSIPSDRLSTTTNTAGYFQIDLWTNADGLQPCLWRVRLPDGHYVEFLLPYQDGSPVDFALLRSLGGTIEDAPDSWLEAVEGVVAEAIAQTVAPPIQFERSFADADLSIAGVLAAAHNLNTYPSSIAVWTNTNIPIQPDSISFVSVNAIALTLESFRPLVGNWRLSIGV